MAQDLAGHTIELAVQIVDGQLDSPLAVGADGFFRVTNPEQSSDLDRIADPVFDAAVLVGFAGVGDLAGRGK